MLAALSAGIGDHHKGKGDGADQNRGLGTQQKGGGEDADEGQVYRAVIADIQGETAADPAEKQQKKHCLKGIPIPVRGLVNKDRPAGPEENCQTKTAYADQIAF